MPVDTDAPRYWLDYLGNIALVPASLLPSKKVWQRIANNLPDGDILIILPFQSKPQRIAHLVASQFRQKGKHVRVIDSMLPQTLP
jgi:hypothetical protein